MTLEELESTLNVAYLDWINGRSDADTPQQHLANAVVGLLRQGPTANAWRHNYTDGTDGPWEVGAKVEARGLYAVVLLDEEN